MAQVIIFFIVPHWLWIFWLLNGPAVLAMLFYFLQIWWQGIILM
uniref:Uncharacterized protein n=1 Tax=Rhizophora mucronata TaxID=61149 RepID=A0A2P2NS95_RHIMU